LDPQSVATTSAVLTRFAPDAAWTVEERSVFDLDLRRDGQFEIVHSWGVLHHTGRLWKALGRAAAMVRPNGLLVVALYAKTPLCGFWRVEKRLYTAAPSWVRAIVRGLFKTSYLAAIAASGRNPATYIRDYSAKRGMSWAHDVHDWLGGYPYESASPEEIDAFLSSREYLKEREYVRLVPAFGIFGSPCHEYVFRREQREQKSPPGRVHDVNAA
jgi:2-polyprenyl-6-hydroxyphenyl methylase/3-demethylubiquinone-9 3-methyltransferase